MMINCETCGGTGGRHPFDMGGPATCCDCCGTGRMPQLTPGALGNRSRAEMRRFESGESGIPLSLVKRMIAHEASFDDTINRLWETTDEKIEEYGGSVFPALAHEGRGGT